MRLAGGFGLLALAGALLAGCGDPATRYPIACPRPAILADGADLVKYDPRLPQDLSGLEYSARIVQIQGGCGRGNRASVVRLAVGFTVDRGPASVNRNVDLHWFIAAVDTRTNRVLAEQDFVDTVQFNPNETRISGLSQDVDLTLPVSEGMKVQDWTVYVAFRLTPDQLAQNRARGPR